MCVYILDYSLLILYIYGMDHKVVLIYDMYDIAL